MSTYNWSEDTRPVCVVPEGGFTNLSQLDNCKLPEGYAGPLISFSSQIVDKHGHLLDGDWDPKRKNGCDHRETKEWKAEHKVHKIHKEVKENPTTNTVAVVEVPSKPLDIPPPPKKADLIASAPMLMGAAAGMVSSMAGPMVTSFLKGQASKLLKGKKGIKEDKAEDKALDCKTHNLQCNTRSMQYSANIQALEARVGNLESKGSDLSFGANNIEELLERIQKLEKKAKKK